MHEQKVGRVFFQAGQVNLAGRTWNRGYASGPQQRVDFFFRKKVHKFGEKDTGSCRNAEGNRAEEKYTDGFSSQENVALCAGSYRETQKNSGGVYDGAAGGFCQAVNDTRLFHDITEEKRSQQGNRCRGEKAAQQQTNHGKNQQLFFGWLARFGHADQPFLPGGEQSHDWRLDDGNERHVRVGGNGDGPD